MKTIICQVQNEFRLSLPHKHNNLLGDTQQGSQHADKSGSMMKGWSTNESMCRINMRRLNNDNMDSSIKINNALFGMKYNIKNVLASYVITNTVSEWVSILFYNLLQPFLRLRGCPKLSRYNIPIVLFETVALISMFRITFVSFYNPSRIEGLCWNSELQPGSPYLSSLLPSIAWHCFIPSDWGKVVVLLPASTYVPSGSLLRGLK